MKIKKSLLVSIAALTVAFGAVGCSSKSTSQSALEKIKEKGTLVIGTSAEYAPYEFHKDIDGKDTITGFDIMIAKDIAKDLGVKLEIKDMKFDGLLGALKAKKIDMIIAGMSPTEERKKAVDFSDVYYNGKNVVLVNKENVDKFKSIKDLANVKMAAQKSSIQENYIKDTIKNNNIKSLSKIPDVVLELNNKNVDAVVISDNTAQSYLKQYTNLKAANISDMTDSEEGSAIAMNKNEKDLEKEVNKVLQNLMSNKKIDQYVSDATKLSQEN